MRKIKIIISSLLMAILMLCLTGCYAGSTINTTLEINKDLSGQRVMSVAIKQDVMDEYFSGSIKDLTACVENNIPASMTYELKGKKGSYVYQFTLPFDSVDDYKSKVEEILGYETNLVITCPDSVWASGVFVKEGFNSNDLLQWFKKAILDGGFVSSSRSDKIFSNGNSIVSFDGNEIGSSSSSIYVDNVTYEKINSIDFTTVAVDMNTVNRTVAFEVSADTMNKKSDEIYAYMNQIVPSNGTISDETTENATVFKYVGENLDITGLEQFMKELLGDENYSLYDIDTFDSFSPFTFNNYIQEEYALSNFVVAQASTIVRQFVDTLDESIDVYGESPLYMYDYYNYSEDVSDMSSIKEVRNEHYYGSNGSGIMTVFLQKVFKVAEANLIIGKNSGDNFTRRTEFILESMPTEEEIALIKSQITSKYEPEVEEETETETDDLSAVETESESLADDYLDDNSYTEDSYIDDVYIEPEMEVPELNIKVTTKGQDRLEVIIEQKGNKESIEYGSELLYKRGDSISYTEKAGFTPEVIWSLDYSGTIGNYADYATDDYRFTYKINLDGGSVIYTNVSEEAYQIQGGYFVKDVTGYNNVNTKVVVKQVNKVFVLFIVLVAIGAALLVISLIKPDLFNMIIPKKKEKENVVIAENSAENS